jgi:glycosyltransferase involved in cell wall biosynthesis
MEKIKATVGVLTFNSDKTLARALESVKEFDDIVICDGGSMDNTLELAHAYSARIIAQDERFKNPDNTLRDYSGVRNQLLDAARHEWFLYIDSDEMVDRFLPEEIRRIVQDPHPPHLVYNLSPRIVLGGRVIEHSSNYPGWQTRFFNLKTGARFRKAIHERITWDLEAYPVGYLKNHWHYFISPEDHTKKSGKYALMDARQYETKSFFRFLELACRKLFTICKVAFKALFNSLIHPRTSMPIVYEWRRIAYQANLLRYLTLAYFGVNV